MQVFINMKKIEFGFKRLSIIDLSNGSQPMGKDNKIIVFNGEICNHKELKNKLKEKGYKFNTNCDTEVLLSLYSDKGKECLKDLKGMFSFIVFDKNNENVFGARDHFGIKPLYRRK